MITDCLKLRKKSAADDNVVVPVGSNAHQLLAQKGVKFSALQPVKTKQVSTSATTSSCWDYLRGLCRAYQTVHSIEGVPVGRKLRR